MTKPIFPFTEANSKRVASLFRQALRTAFDSSLKFDAYRRETIKIRSQFEANKHISDPNELESVIQQAKAKLAEYAHPDPYIPPCRPGGTKYEKDSFRAGESLSVLESTGRDKVEAYAFIIPKPHMELIQFHEEKCRGNEKSVDSVNVKAVGSIRAE
ncbi:hypothetical protein E0198_004574 [Clavispora lusitaniae]|nr:hypothetical protein E0198_004574 [Clavispora lusitaniae]